MIRSIAGAALATCVLTLAGCGSSEPMTPEKVQTALKAGGVPFTDVKSPARDPASPLPNSYKDRFTFALPSVAPKGGQVFICEKKEHCDAIYSYLDALKGLAGPYLYRSQDGRVVAQLNSGLQPSEAEPVRAVIEKLQ